MDFILASLMSLAIGPILGLMALKKYTTTDVSQ